MDALVCINLLMLTYGAVSAETYFKNLYKVNLVTCIWRRNKLMVLFFLAFVIFALYFALFLLYYFFYYVV